ncbi:hypothetical protein TNCV_3165461 [Trichonephila clavipes]|nr:hypothetical protein TNCV_3165461 [Trichonephila clavipes]
MRSRRRSSRADVTFRRPLSVFRVVWMLVGPSLPHHCETVPLHSSSYRAVGKSSFSKADNSPRSNSCHLRSALMQFRSAEVQSPPVSGVGSFGDGG